MLSIWEDCSLTSAQELEPLILDASSKLSKRGRDAFNSVYRKSGNVSSFAHLIISADFSWKSLSHIGQKTCQELTDFTASLLDLFQKHKNLKGIEDWESLKREYDLRSLGIRPKDAKRIVSIEHNIGHFPLCAFTYSWIIALDERDKFICENGMNIWSNRELMGLTDIAEHLDITNERARQLRVKVFDDLKSIISRISTDVHCHYDFLSESLVKDTEDKEGSSFNANFTRFLIGSYYNEMMVVGNVEDAIMFKLRGGDAAAFIAAVPRELCSEFDFNGFIEQLSALHKEPHTETILFPLPENTRLNEVSSKLAYLNFGWKTDDSSLVIPPNADKNLPEIMEDIIKRAGHPLTIDQILEEYARLYPSRIADKNRIRANMQSNPRITPIGRSGVYSLSDWKDGSSRGGTIRSFVRECIETSESHIVPMSQVIEYVRQFRPTITQENLIANLMLETEKSFSVIWKDNESYLTYSSQDVPDDFKKITRTYSGRRSFEENIELLKKFISEQGRMPQRGRDNDESRLAAFLSNQRSLRQRGLISKEREAIIEDIEKRLSGPMQLELF